MDLDLTARNKQSLKPICSDEPEGAFKKVVRDSGPIALTQQDMQATSEDIVRKMMAEQWREENRRSLPEILPDHSDDTKEDGGAACSDRAKRRKAWGKALKEMPEDGLDVENADTRQPRRGLMARFMRHQTRPQKPATKFFIKRWHVILGGLCVTMILNPMLIASLLAGAFWLMVAASLMFGPGRVVDFIHGSWLWFARHNPVFAAALRNAVERLDNPVFAAALRYVGGILVCVRDAALDRLPDQIASRWTKGSEEDEVVEDQECPFERRLKAEVFRG